MSVEPFESTEEEALRQRIEALEREQHERTARANEALAAAQDRSYWLDRWNLDLNALMRRRGASEMRAVLRGVRSVYRVLNDARHRLGTVPVKLREVQHAVEEERAHAEPPLAQFTRTLSPDPLTAAPATDILHARLAPDDIGAIEGDLQPVEAALWETADPVDRKRLTLAFIAHRDLQPALERTGLSAAMPSTGVHSMASGPAAAGGSAYYADLVTDSLAQSGMRLRPGLTGLDFGCSSGRVVRVLAAAFPDVGWHGCDPIPEAIAWAREHLPGIAFERTPEYPPLPYDEDSFDFAFAISIWSHFAEGAALDWLRELGRVIRPGGRLLLTTHGAQTIAHTGREGVRSPAQLDEIRAALDASGFWYAPEFGEIGDHGIANPDWGTAFLTPEWLLARCTPHWSVTFFRPGRVEGDQDLYVLERS